MKFYVRLTAFLAENITMIFAYQHFVYYLLLLSLGSCTYVSADAETTPQAQRVTVVTGLIRPWSMAFLSEEEVLVTEKEGSLKRVNLATGTQQVIKGFPKDLDNTPQHDPRDNAGLFDVVLDPDYANSAWVYIAYSASEPGGSTTKVIRGQLRKDSLTNVQALLVAEPFSPDRFHYGGGMVFGTDNKLYVTVGERYFREIEQPSLPIAQDVQDRRGMIYRLNPDGSLPDDNPDWGSDAVPGAYAIGIRAAQGITCHPESGQIWFSEHGSRQGDEINILQAGANYGWPLQTTGQYRDSAYIPPPIGDRVLTDPVWSWDETVAPTGLTFYTGSEFPAWQGSLFVAGLSGGSLRRLTVEGEQVKAAEKLFADDPIRLRQVIQSPGGKLYLLTDEIEGRILRIDPAP
ncbi:PQQ-dependent sugar dehydrogenase [Tunicatimonas pelagia]|uniref:PQQ-dependent sugar dehydrogenase n=1 Tax=Tunicatimonas pelagia TaxID=931531 RepID=UPI00266609D4|nr:PQQ-dependent sugar dehydrogenase [Tunicatimonas pelagia]WKN44145.1 PQQ-dependent sugar dehydrogenase [Tunicatimonas pelagia]